jgi:HEAT repeat protein
MMLIDTPEALVAALSGPASESTWHWLAESEPDLRLVSGAFSIGKTHVQVLLLQVLREWRTPECLSLARVGLNSTEPQVWKEALDVLVTIGDEAAAAELRQTLNFATGEKWNWIQEALQQVTADEVGPG